MRQCEMRQCEALTAPPMRAILWYTICRVRAGAQSRLVSLGRTAGRQAASGMATSESFWPPPHTLPAGGADDRPRPVSWAGIPPCVRLTADAKRTKDRLAQTCAAVPATWIVANAIYQERRPAGLVAAYTAAGLCPRRGLHAGGLGRGDMDAGAPRRQDRGAARGIFGRSREQRAAGLRLGLHPLAIRLAGRLGTEWARLGVRLA